MLWVRLSGLLGFLYKIKILEEIGGLIGTVTKLDFQTDKVLWGCLPGWLRFGHTKEACSSNSVSNGSRMGKEKTGILTRVRKSGGTIGVFWLVERRPRRNSRAHHVISSVGQQGPVSPNRPVYMVPTVGQQGLATSSRPVHKDHTGKDKSMKLGAHLEKKANRESGTYGNKFSF
ncbi:hypothetical protein GOBAR_DD14535 [Gossypium barbadense]|nr:hypothetical protein GOBAR_DD14535 [Gossypium barbadense]